MSTQLQVVIFACNSLCKVAESVTKFHNRLQASPFSVISIRAKSAQEASLLRGLKSPYIWNYSSVRSESSAGLSTVPRSSMNTRHKAGFAGSVANLSS